MATVFVMGCTHPTDFSWSSHHARSGAATTRTALPRSTPSASRTAASTPTIELHARGRNARTPPDASLAPRQRTNHRKGVSSSARSTHTTAPLSAPISTTTGATPNRAVPRTCHSTRLSARNAHSDSSSRVTGTLTTSRRCGCLPISYAAKIGRLSVRLYTCRHRPPLCRAAP